MMSRALKTIAVFCGSKLGKRKKYIELVKSFAAAIVESKLTLIYGGENHGLLAELANQTLKLGGKVVGVIPKSLVEKKCAHKKLTEKHIVSSFQERKAMILKLADACVMLPGGLGSLDEFSEALTLAQIGERSKPCGILNVANYFDHLIKYLEHAWREGLIEEKQLKFLIVEDNPKIMLQRLTKLH